MKHICMICLHNYVVTITRTFRFTICSIEYFSHVHILMHSYMHLYIGKELKRPVGPFSAKTKDGSHAFFHAQF